MKIKKTRALKKICKLKKRIWVLRGGQGSAKTFSVLQILINHASSNAGKFILIASEELSKMKLTCIKDFIFILKEFELFESERWIGKTEYTFKNGSIIKFIGLDKDDIGKGLRSDIFFLNEANKCKFATYNQIASRAKRVILDYNPDVESWIETEVLKREDAELLVLTFEDNEALAEEERNAILQYYKDGFDENGNVKNEYWANHWRVYGLGLLGSIAGAIYQNWSVGEFDESLPHGYGMDFGSDDPDALVKVAVDKKNKIIYLDELIYQNNLSTDDLIRLTKECVDNAMIIADSSGKRTIDDLKSKGINITKVHKYKITEDIKLIQGYKIIVTARSSNIIKEFGKYVYKNGIPIDKFNHAMDAFRYCAQTIIRGLSNLRTHRLIKR